MRVPATVLFSVIVLSLFAMALNPDDSIRACRSPLPSQKALRTYDDLVSRKFILWTGKDMASYIAAADPGLSPRYAAQRAPYLFRVLGPAVIRCMTYLGIPLCWGFWTTAFAGLLLAAIAVHQIALLYDLRPIDAGLAALLVVLNVKGLRAVQATRIDPPAWALLFWGWWAWLKHKSLLSCALFVAAILGHEVTLLIVPSIVFHAVRFKYRRLDLCLLVSAMAVAFMVPRLALQPANQAPVTLLFAWAAIEMHFLLRPTGATVIASEYILGLGAAGFCMLLAMGRNVPRRMAPLAVYVPLLCIFVFPLEQGRLLVPAGAVSGLVALAILREIPQPLSGLARVGMLGTAGLAAAAFVLGRGATWVTLVGGFATAALLAYGLLARVPSRAPRQPTC